MTRSTPTRDDVPLGVKLIVLGALTLFALACVQLRRPEVHEWWFERGPVIPHDTFPADCSLCHTGDGWTTLRDDFSFDHELETGVALLGAHAEAECLRCHNDRGPAGAYAAQGCVGCHEDVHRTQLGQACARCHVETSWRPKEEIAIHTRVGFPLEGAHLTAQCWECHDGADQGVFTGAPRDCAVCHAEDVALATDPDHLAQGWTASCERCHVPTSWAGEGFTHSTFPLVASHRSVDCAECHVGGLFEGTASACADCHFEEWQATSDPNHMQAGFGAGCESCHVPNEWDQGSYPHSSFALAGAHAAPDCSECHVGNVFEGLPSECADCHQTDYDGASDPNHIAEGFPLQCDQCHTVTMWERANFDHDIWPLTGSHAPLACDECHGGEVYEGTSQECIVCHFPSWQAETNPDHLAAGLSTICQECHNTTAWAGATYAHRVWPLTGAHTAADCIDCHAGGTYAGLPSTCVSCHLSDYRSTNDPDHAAAGFPTSCESCHTTVMWEGARFNHNFPIDRGDHSGLSCNECHQQPRAFQVFSCTHCHEHSQREMADEHDRVSGYTWTSSACYQCHPDGDR